MTHKIWRLLPSINESGNLNTFRKNYIVVHVEDSYFSYIKSLHLSIVYALKTQLDFKPHF
jgi:hypothetical protein